MCAIYCQGYRGGVQRCCGAVFFAFIAVFAHARSPRFHAPRFHKCTKSVTVPQIHVIRFWCSLTPRQDRHVLFYDGLKFRTLTRVRHWNFHPEFGVATDVRVRTAPRRFVLSSAMCTTRTALVTIVIVVVCCVQSPMRIFKTWKHERSC